MALGFNVTTSENLAAGSGTPIGAGAAFVVGRFDQGPPAISAALAAPGVVKCQSINDAIVAFGPRSATSAKSYDWLDTFFQEAPGGAIAYVTRDTDVTATAATLTLNDAGSHPTVVVTELTPGLAGNNTYVVVTRGTAATFTMNTTNSSTAVTNVSSFANIGVGTPITGAGIPANTYVSAVNVAGSSLTLSAAATATASSVTITPATFTVAIQDGSGAGANVLSTHGPYSTTASLFADTTSALVSFSQSAGSGFTAFVPVASAAAALSGGANANDLSSATAVATLTNFPATLGPGTVVITGVTTPDTTIWTGLDAHAKANNRWAAKDLADSASAATLIQAIGAWGTTANASYGAFFASSLIVPGTVPNVPRTVSASAAVAALRARVSATGNENQAPAGIDWPLNFVTGLTNTYGYADTVTLNNAGINTFQTPASGLGLPALCLAGFSSPVNPSLDPIFWQASAACERMALIAEGKAIMSKYLFKPLDGQLLTITACQHDLQAMVANHWANKALFGTAATDAGVVSMGAPVNQPSTEQLGQLNANLTVRITPFAQSGTLSIVEIPITQTI